MLEVESLATGYDRSLVLHDVSLRVGEGEVVAVVGSNGAGKTTFLNTVAGLHRPRTGVGVRGRIAFDGADVTGSSASRRVRAGMALVPERRQVWPELSVADNLRLGGFVKRRDKRWVSDRTAHCYAMFPWLEERSHQHAGTLSGGEQQMLAIARALMAGPRMLLLDEPSSGLAPLVVRRIFEVVRELKNEGLTVLIVEQMVTMALGVADRGYVLERGRTVLSGSSHELLNDPGVRAAYLGVQSDAAALPDALLPDAAVAP